MFIRVMLKEFRAADGNKIEQLVAYTESEKQSLPCFVDQPTSNIYFILKGKIYRPYFYFKNSHEIWFLKKNVTVAGKEVVGVGSFFSFLVTNFEADENGIITGVALAAVQHANFNVNSIDPLSLDSNTASSYINAHNGELLPSDRQPLLTDRKRPFAFNVSSSSALDRFVYSIQNHPFRTIAGLLLTALFLGLLIANPVTLFPLLQPFAYVLQSVALSLGGIVPTAIGGSLLTLTAPKWVGNILQFVGDKIIGGLVNGLLFIPYLIFLMIGSLTNILGPEKGDKNYIDFQFKQGVTVGHLWGIPLFLLQIPIYLTHYIGEGLNKLGMLIAGEFGMESSVSEKVKKKDEVDDEAADNTSCFNTAGIVAVIKNYVPEFPSDSFQQIKRDPAILGWETRESIAKMYSESMIKFGSIFTLKQQFKLREEFDRSAAAPKPGGRVS